MISEIIDKKEGKIIDTIKDKLGRIIYEAWKKLIASGIPPLTLLKSKQDNLLDYKIYGDSVQDGTPTPEAPIEIESVGDYDETTGKYRIPVKSSDGKEEVITNIYLDEPLRKIGDYADYIDFENKKLIRNVHVDKISEISNVKYYEPLSTYPYGFFTAYTKNTKRNGFEVLSNIYTNNKNLFKMDKNIFGNASSNNIYIIDKDYTDPVILINTLKDNEIHYVLATPKTQPIELPNIPTLKGTTILSVDTNINASYMEVEYIGGGDNQLLDEENNLILNEIIATDTETELNITNTEINNILDEIIGG